ncbi:hypothetical protein [Holdemanella biformis]|uniref:hypothetical protein n=1 Tax=Holdemanella biformis TaxID=1735 RepID=UPI003AB4C69D
MISVLNEINSQGIFTIILCVVLVLLLIVEGTKLWKGTLESLGLKTNKELQEQSLNKRLDELEHKIKIVENSFMNNQEVYHNQSIEIRNHLQENQENLSNQITELSTVINDFATTSKECTVASFRSSLWRMHRDFVSQGYITPDGLKTFLDMGNLYERCGGDDIYHEKLLPEIKALEVHYPEGSVYNE